MFLLLVRINKFNFFFLLELFLKSNKVVRDVDIFVLLTYPLFLFTAQKKKKKSKKENKKK